VTYVHETESTKSNTILIGGEQYFRSLRIKKGQGSLKIQNGHRSYAGAKASDIFLSLMGTCRKNNVSFWDYLKDRVFKTRSIPELKEIILAD
jgi:hypothetical protein